MVDLALLQSVSYIAGALGVCVAAAYYVMNLRISQRNQELMLKSQESSVKTQELALKSQQQATETRQAQLFMQVFNRYHDPEFWGLYLKGISSDWKSYDEWERHRSDPEMRAMMLSVGTYFEGIGVLVYRGLLAPDLVADILGGAVVTWWNKHGEYFREIRVRADYPQYAEYQEFLYNEIMKLRGSGYSPKWGDPEASFRSGGRVG